MPYTSEYDEGRLKEAANYMDNWSVDTTYIGKMNDDRHLMCFHHNHVIPEDEKISSAYLVKLTRYFVKAVNQHLENWQSIENLACGSA